MLEELSSEAIAALVANLPSMPLAEKEALLSELETLEHKKLLKRCRDDFLTFCAHLYPEWKEGPHHRYMKPLLHKVRDGEETRLTVSMPPRFGKSETIAYMFVAWYLGHLPNHHIMMATHTAALSADFGRKVRNLLDTKAYREIFPNTAVSKDKSAADNWTTTAGGKYLAIGIGANVAGHGAHLLVVDDLCIHKNSIVHTPHGDVPAYSVLVGDYLLGESGWQQVVRKTTSEHATSVCIDGLWVSNEHPVWTFNAGWQRASKIALGDMLRTITFWCKIKSSIIRGLKNVTTSKTVRSVQARVQHLGNDETAVQQPQGRQLHQLWRGGDQGVSRVRDVFGVFATSWPRAINQTYAGSHRQRAGVHSAELPLGRRGDAAEQPNERGSFCVPGEDAVITAVGEDCRHTDSENGASAKGAQNGGRRRNGVAEAELGAAPRKTEEFGWGVGAAVRLFGLSSRLRHAAAVAKNNPPKGRGCAKQYAAGLRWVQEAFVCGVEGIAACLGVLVGVRRVSRVEHIDTAGQFVNFEVRGDNTFFAQGILTHNCSEQAVLSNPDAAFATAWEYIQVGPLQRLMPGGKIVMIGTRWGKKDPIGRALAWAENNPNSTPWTEVRFPAILPSGKSLWPEQWPVDQLLAKKAGMQPQFWAAQYMQEPTSEEGAILKREWWQIWEKDDPPDVEFVIQVWDTAHDTKSHNDFSACITWGVWFNEETRRHEIIMLNAVKGRWEFPQLKQKAMDEYKEWQPECLLIEKKAAGAPLIQELRQMELIVEDYSPSRAGAGVSNDKRARVNSVAPMLFDKVVWAPDHRWAFEVINECAEFPHGEHDDFVDCFVAGTQILLADGTTRAIERVQEGEFVHTPKGPRRVQVAVCTGTHATMRLQTTQGQTIEATPNHPVATTRGWVRLADVRVTDTIKIASVKESVWRSLKKKASHVKQWFLTATPTAVTLKQRALRIENISCVLAGASYYIGRFGSTTTAPYPASTMCTTSTTTPGTMPSRTWHWSQPLNILRSTLKNVRVFAPRLCGSIWQPSETRLLHGTQAKTVAVGTQKSPQKTSGQAEPQESRWTQLGQNAARTLTNWYAKCVALRSRQKSAAPVFVAKRASVETIAPTNEKRQVFNLAVEDAQCFYANGVLVHNCVSMALARYRRGGFVSLSSDRKDEPQLFRRRSAAYY
jgi:predicted phage terminase large subunit-like protein